MRVDRLLLLVGGILVSCASRGPSPAPAARPKINAQGAWMITDDSPGLLGQSARNYSNVLLTLLAEGPVKSAVVATNRELPSLLEIAAGDAKRLDGFATFSLAEANAGRPFLIGLLVGLTGYRGPDDAFVDGTLPSVVFGPGGSKREVRLRLHQAKIGDEIELTITAP